MMQTRTQTQGHTHTHLPPPVVHPLQTYHSLVYDVMLPDPSSAVFPSLSSHTLLSLFLILLVAPACICWISSDSLHTRAHTYTHSHTCTHTHTHFHAPSHTHSYTYTTRGIPPSLQPLLLHLAPVLPQWGASTVSPFLS